MVNENNNENEQQNIDPTISGVVQGMITQYRNRKKRKDLSLRKKVQFKNRFTISNKKILERKYIEKSRTGGEGNNTRKQKKMTKLELYCLDILTELNFKVEREFKMLGKYYDFKIYGHKNIEINDLIKNAKILIETDGDYWHNKENDNVSIRFVKQSIEDKYKNSLSLIKGYNLLRIFESEISRLSLKEKILDLLFKLYPEIKWNKYII